MYGIATCNNGEDGDTATYCDKDRDGRNGNEIFEVTRQDDDRQAGWAQAGHPAEGVLQEVRRRASYAYIYNKHKQSTWWIQVDYKGKNYIPWAWLNLDGGDDLDVLPTC